MQWWCAAQGVAWSWSWRPYPGVWIFIGLLALGFVAAHRRAGSDPDPVFRPGARGAFAACGLLLLWIALDWPVGALGAGYLASVHMVQFILIGVAAPPLLLLGVPGPLVERRMERGMARRAALVLGHPIVAMGQFASVMAFTHWPPVVDTLMATQLGSFVLDMLWLVSGLVFWWPVAVARPVRPWLTEPFKMGYLIAATIVNTGVFAYLTYSELPLYATFELAPPVGGLSTRDDQLIAGLLMKVGGAVVLWTAITILFFRWFRRSEREDRVEVGGAAALLALAVPLALTACGPSSGSSADAGGPRTVIAVIAEPLADDRAALYLRIENPGADPDTLVSVAVEGVGRTSLHRTREQDGLITMEPLEGGAPVPPGGSLRMAPGGTHVMLEELRRPLRAGDRVEVTLRFARAGERGITARVSPLRDLEAILHRPPRP